MKDREESQTIKLQSFMARAGVASRRRCEQIIKEGRVEINGVRVSKLGIRVSLDDIVRVDGKRIEIVDKKCYLAINKPTGYICSNSDPFGRHLVVDLIPHEIRKNFPHLFHVGRLDYNSSGLIFYTNDGVFANIIMHPSFEVEKEYFVKFRETIDEADLLRYKMGIRIDGMEYHLISYKIANTRGVFLTLNEGRYREIRAVFSFLGYSILQLKRVRIGIVRVDSIPLGGYRELTGGEIGWFYKISERGKKK